MTKRVRPDWITYFMDGAQWASSRSIDPNTQVGCIITDARSRLVSSGYNSFPAGVDDSFWPTTKESIEVDPGLFVNKYQIVQHAEANAIAAANGSLVGCDLYVTHHPCNDCAKLIATAGISRVYYKNYRDKDESKIAALILKQAKIALIQTK